MDDLCDIYGVSPKEAAGAYKSTYSFDTLAAIAIDISNKSPTYAK
jgi:hypothetical protein